MSKQLSTYVANAPLLHLGFILLAAQHQVVTGIIATQQLFLFHC